MSRSFDEAELLARVDNDWDFLGETVGMLTADGRALLADIRRAADAGDAPGVSRAAHALKGMISNFSSPDTQASALTVEQMGKAHNLSGAPAAVEALAGRLEALIADLTEFVATRAH